MVLWLQPQDHFTLENCTKNITNHTKGCAREQNQTLNHNPNCKQKNNNKSRNINIQQITILISKRVCKNQNHINKDTYTKQATCKKPQNTRSNFTHIKSMYTKNTQEPTKQKSHKFTLRFHIKILLYSLLHIFLYFSQHFARHSQFLQAG